MTNQLPLIENLLPAFFDEDALHVAPVQLCRMDVRGQRYYFKPDSEILYPSVTTITGKTMPTPPHLIKWIAEKGVEQANEIKDAASEYGTFMHAMNTKFLIEKYIDLDSMGVQIERYCSENNIKAGADWNDKICNDLLCFAQFVYERKVQPLFIESSLLHEEIGYAGTIDLVCRMTWRRKEIVALLDYKSGRKGFYESNKLQLAAYHQAVIHNFRDLIPITETFNWAPTDFQGTTPTYKLECQTDKDGLVFEKFMRLKALFDMDVKPTTAFIQPCGLLVYANDPIHNLRVHEMAEIVKTKKPTKRKKRAKKQPAKKSKRRAK